MDYTLASLFWATFGMGDTSATKIDYRYLGVGNDMITTHSKHLLITVIMGYLLFWSYIVGSVVVLLNMLIAMMSNSFQEIYVSKVKSRQKCLWLKIPKLKTVLFCAIVLVRLEISLYFNKRNEGLCFLS